MSAIQWMCTVCGKKELKVAVQGRPAPGTCPKAKTAGRPHRWVKNKVVGPSGSTGGKNTAERYMVVGGKKVKF